MAGKELNNKIQEKQEEQEEQEELTLYSMLTGAEGEGNHSKLRLLLFILEHIFGIYSIGFPTLPVLYL